MKKIIIIVCIILFIMASYHMYSIGFFIFRVAIGAMLLGIFLLGFYIGRLTKK